MRHRNRGLFQDLFNAIPVPLVALLNDTNIIEFDNRVAQQET
jgi:hypothetical protein